MLVTLLVGLGLGSLDSLYTIGLEDGPIHDRLAGNISYEPSGYLPLPYLASSSVKWAFRDWVANCALT